MANALYRLESVRQRRDGKLVLDVDALTLRAGHSYTLVGPNGSGKTTLLHILGFLARPSSGDVRFDGERVAWRQGALLRLRRQVTLVHQTPYLFAGTVEENLRVGLFPRSVAREDARGLVADALRSVGLAGFERRGARALSQGEAQRVGIARALLLRPRVLLLDEPVANLDRKSTRAIEDLVAALPAAGHTVVMASHDPGHPARFGSEVIALHGGVLASSGRAPVDGRWDRAPEASGRDADPAAGAVPFALAPGCAGDACVIAGEGV